MTSKLAAKKSAAGNGPEIEDHEIVIVGAGFSGIGMAIKLREAGFQDFVLVEREADLGGTWFVNNYPGCACDVQSHMYSFSFEPNPSWTREFATQPEIHAYLRGCAQKHGLYERVLFKSQALGARYDEPSARWLLEIADSDAVDTFMRAKGKLPGDPLPKRDPARPVTRLLRAKVLISGMGGLSTPAYPKLKGLERFQGKTFHSQRWDHEYDLRGKRVAVIGTGASSIQFVPQIQPQVQQLDVYQRSAPWILPKPDRAISRAERFVHEKVPLTRSLRRLGLYAMLEGRAVAFVLDRRLMSVGEAASKLYLRSQVRDAALRKLLTPDYAMGCKRVLMSNDWYSALTKPNVDVVTSGIAEVKENSIVDSLGVERKADALIYGTGFRITDLVARGLIEGRAGLDLVDAWPEGPQAYKGTCVTGFPNLFLLLGPNTGLGHNSVVYMIEAQIQYVMGAMRAMREQQLSALEVRPEAQANYDAELQAKSEESVWKSGGCQSYYLHPESGRNIAVWPDFTFRFRNATRHFDIENYRVETNALGDVVLGTRVRAAVHGAQP